MNTLQKPVKTIARKAKAPAAQALIATNIRIICTRNFNKSSDTDPKFQNRQATAAPSQYQAKNAVVLKNVQFVSTGVGTDFAYESGFGCGTVMVGETVESVNAETLGALVPIRFNGAGFERSERKGFEPYIKSAALVVFNAAGMFAIL